MASYHTAAHPTASPGVHGRAVRSVQDGTIAAAFGGGWSHVDDVGEGPAPLAWAPFPVEALPEPFRSFVADTARARQCDPVAVALPLLAVLAGAIGTARVLRAGPDWLVPSVLWTAVVASSGATTSPGFRAALAPLRKLEQRDLEAWASEHATFVQQQLVYEAALADWRKDRGRGQPPEAPTEPARPRCLVEDPTIPALGRVLKDNPRGVVLARDELSGWVCGFGQYNGSSRADLSRWLEIYGAGPLSADRKGDGHQYVPRAAVSVTGTIQSEIAPRVSDGEVQAAGLFARFLLAAPPKPHRHWQGIRDAPRPQVDALLCHLEQLRALDLPEPGQPARELILSSAAERAWGLWFDDHRARRHDTEPGPWRSAMSKLEETPCRLALVLELARTTTPGEVVQVSGDTMRWVLELTNWFRAEGKRLYAQLAESPQARLDRQLAEWEASRPAGATARDAARRLHRYRGRGGPPSSTSYGP